VASAFLATANISNLYFVAADVAPDTQATYRLWKLDAQSGDVVDRWKNLGGIGGAISGDGERYLYIKVESDAANLHVLNLVTGKDRALTHFSGATSLGTPTYSPSGQQIAYARRTALGWDLFLLNADGSTRPLTQDGRFNYAPSWVSEDELIFLREHQGRTQVFKLTLSTGVFSQLTDAPYAVLDPVVLPNSKIAFLNRDKRQFSLDSVSLRPDAAPAVVETALTPPDQVAGFNIENDSPYSDLDHLFRPSLRVPFLWASADSSGRMRYTGFLSLQGNDRLGRHSWAINTAFTNREEYGVGFGYGNFSLAPWFFSANASQGSQVLLDGIRIVDTVVQLSTGRPVWTSGVNLSFKGIDTLYEPLGAAAEPGIRRKILGPSLSWAYAAVDGTAYAGTQRGLTFSASASTYPSSLGSFIDLADLSAHSKAWVPLPLLRRHSLELGLRGRSIISPVPGMLRVGGFSSGQTLLEAAQTSVDAPPILLPGRIAFAEALRGYDDFAFRTNHLVVGSATYRIPFIFDQGAISTFWLLPSFFLSQLDLEGFYEHARSDPMAGQMHRSAGAALILRGAIGSLLPLSLFYQYAYRFDDALGSQHVVGLSTSQIDLRSDSR
jgi:hypothetical protein